MTVSPEGEQGKIKLLLVPLGFFLESNEGTDSLTDGLSLSLVFGSMSQLRSENGWSS